MILVIGNAGFIDGNFVLDKLIYVGNLATFYSLKQDTRHVFIRGNISDYG
jgi:dTDP-glucose 4,6-dehydratase